MMRLDRDEMRKRFATLAKMREQIRAKADPLRAKRDAQIQNHAKEIAAFDKKIQSEEKGLYDIDNEMAMIARALGHQGVGPTEEELGG